LRGVEEQKKTGKGRGNLAKKDKKQGVLEGEKRREKGKERRTERNNEEGNEGDCF